MDNSNAPYRLVHNRVTAVRNPKPDTFPSIIDIKDNSFVLGEWPEEAPTRKQRLSLIAEYPGGKICVLERAEQMLGDEVHSSSRIQFQERRSLPRKGWLRAKILGPTIQKWVDIENYDVESFRSSVPPLRVVE